ncbi:MAG TPA: hypothetical protein DF783_07920 [Acidimicrobiaceae bacterium]|jgi:hypothetical protein|nr:hypothetical protein [Acidimicrobiaceae bacterium]MDP7258608.1 hypothetical protein [Acidimicrobiales bacterium]HCV36840.1 hypothetical protein [Acidimicrobiaceae bacterium]HJO79974.1 hypothetical protein [Acidimicrobiales bacterium]|tara:strand:- start:648 stop:914 length:267 start_codon:yes stop_codon:yes gene_type:complete
MSEATTGDEVLVRRARASRIASNGQRLGYLAFLAAIVVFAAGLSTTFTDGVATALVVLLVFGSIVLAPSIVLHHAVKAAASEDSQSSG